MGERFDAWVTEFELWGMTHDEALAEAEQDKLAQMSLAFDKFEEALAEAFAPALRLIEQFVLRFNGEIGEQADDRS